jgi:hypothetical protein
MTARCPEHIAAGNGFARCHRPPGHRPPCHAAGRTWWPYGDAGQRLRRGVGCFPDCAPIPAPPRTRPAPPAHPARPAVATAHRSARTAHRSRRNRR